MNYIKRGLIIHLFFFSMIPFGTAQLTVQGLLHIQGEAALHVQDGVVIQTADGVVENNGTLAIEGNLEKSDAATLNTNPSGQGTRTVVMTGSATQRIDGNFTGDQSFYNLEVDKANGMVELNNDIEISQRLDLTNGKIRTDITSQTQSSDYLHEVFISNSAANAIAGNSIANNSFIEGNLRRAVAGMGIYSFPVGLTENELATIQFTSPAASSEVTATFENRTISQSGTTVTCDNSEMVNIDCVMGSWNIQGNGMGDNYNITLNPGVNLLNNCLDAGTFFVAKDGQVNCPEDANIMDGIQSTGFTGFGVFDIPTAANGNGNADCGLANPVATYLGGRRSSIDWPNVPNAKMYRVQIRFKGMDRWLVTATIRSSKVSVFAPNNREYEYRIQTICEDGESEYTQVFEWSTSGNGLVSAESRNSDDFKADVTIEDIATSTFEAFPNPVNDYLQLNYTPTTDKAMLQVYHVSGKQVLEQPLTKDQAYHSIDMQALSEGIYMLTVTEKGKRMQSQRVIKGSNH